MVVVGTSGAIGRATARAFAQAGATLRLVNRQSPRSTGAVAESLSTLSGTGHKAYVAEITKSATLTALRDRLAQDCGSIDVLINASGFTKAIPHHDLDALTDEFIDEMFQVNWRAQFAVIRAMTPLLKRSGAGLIVSLSSIAAFTAVGSNIAYCAAKAGLDVMTKGLARVLAPEIRVLAVSPGVVDTSFVPGRDAAFSARIAASTPIGRIATADDIAMAILSCATHLRYSTGHIIQVDGGRAL